MRSVYFAQLDLELLPFDIFTVMCGEVMEDTAATVYRRLAFDVVTDPTHP